MLELIFHVGMGKTGTTSLQRALSSSNSILNGHGIRYLGMWQELISKSYLNYEGFQLFRKQPSEQQVESADILTERLKEISITDGINRFIFSNEQYFENVENLNFFFNRLQENLRLRFLIWVRPVDKWLPSACAQWGILHKTNTGPVQSFAEQASRLVQQYRYLPIWVNSFGNDVTVLPFSESTDPISDFSNEIGIVLRSNQERHQSRPDPAELLLRAAFNTQFDEIVLPEKFNAAMEGYKNLTSAKGIVEKADIILGRNAIPKIIAQHQDLLEEASRAAGFNVAGTCDSQEDSFTDMQLINLVLGRLVEIVAGQARDLAVLRSQIKSLEEREGF